jgi:hypothetical protein
MTIFIIAPRALNFLIVTLFMRGSRPMALGWQLRQAPIFNGDGMGTNLPYLWLGLAWCYVALMCCVSPHPRMRENYIKIIIIIKSTQLKKIK